MNIAIRVLEDALDSERNNLKMAYKYMEQQRDGRPEFYKEAAESIKERICSIEKAINVLSENKT